MSPMDNFLEAERERLSDELSLRVNICMKKFHIIAFYIYIDSMESVSLLSLKLRLILLLGHDQLLGSTDWGWKSTEKIEYRMRNMKWSQANFRYD